MGFGLDNIINYENSDSITLRKVLSAVVSSSAEFHELWEPRRHNPSGFFPCYHTRFCI